MNKGQQISRLLNHDRNVLISNDGRSIKKLCDHFGVDHVHVESGTQDIRVTFDDGSAIVVSIIKQAWDFPLSIENEWCFCFQGNGNHKDSCPVVSEPLPPIDCVPGRNFQLKCWDGEE